MRAIELKDVDFSYNGCDKVLRGVDFFVNYGEIALLYGYSGEGKSTLLNIISGIIPNVIQGEYSGEVRIDGKDIKGCKLGEVTKKVGIVLQNADNQIIHKYVEDEIAFGLENFAVPKEKMSKRITKVAEMMRLEPDWRTRSLSGGQKQRLITASTLATGQKILILDEPLANLDKEGAGLLMSTLKILASAGYAVLIVEHRIDMVLSYVDSVWKIRGGHVENIDDPHNRLEKEITLIEDDIESFSGEEKLFELKNVSFKVKKREILKDISFDVYRGERLLLLGENGSGKTTLLRLIARLSRLTGGEIIQNLDRRFGKTRGSKKWFKNVGVVYQNPSYQLFMPTVEKEIAFNAASKEYADEIIELFKLEHIKDRHPQSLSEGQKRRVSIAAVVAGKPEVLILDEPTVGQDYEGLSELIKILNKIHAESGNTMITVTHDKRAGEALTDRAVIIGDGIVKETGGKELTCKFFNIR